MWVLERPVSLGLLALVPLLVYLRHIWPRRGGRLLVPFSIATGTTFRGPLTARRAVMALAAASFWGALIAAIIALAGPTRTERRGINLTRGVDIMIVLDQSASMAAQDFAPLDRFAAAREVIRSFVAARSHDYIGLVGFSAEAALRVPPTLRYSYLVDSLDAMQLMELGDGTAIGMGMALATLHLQSSGAEERVIILLTDGVNNAGEISPEAAAEVAGSLGIRIYAIGVGSGREVAFEVRDPETGQLYRGTVRESFDGETLRRVADLSGGRYFNASSAGTLEAIFQSIGTAESTERRVRVEVERRPRHRPFIIVALVLLGVDLLLRRLVVGSIP